MTLIIGSLAASCHSLTERAPKDFDYIGTYSELQELIKQVKADRGIKVSMPLDDTHWHIRDSSGWNYEFEIAWEGSSGAALLALEGAPVGSYKEASKEALLALKLSHRYKKNSPHFLKTMRDIQSFRNQGVVLTPELEAWLPHREAETYVYKHPKLDVSKGEFFSGDGVPYVYDHDSIHLTVALLGEHSSTHAWPTPAYTFYMQDGAAVMTDKEKFFTVDDEIRLYGVYEESCVLALERSQIPYADVDVEPWVRSRKLSAPTPRWSFEMALMKVCTSITSGWFREYAWENYDRVLDLYNELGEEDYIERFKRNSHLLRPFVPA